MGCKIARLKQWGAKSHNWQNIGGKSAIKPKKKIMGYIDTGATLCFGRKSISKEWIRLKKPKEIIIADKTKHKIWFVLKNTFIKIEHRYFYVRSIYEHDSGIDLIIGNNFLKLYNPFIQKLDTITLKDVCGIKESFT